MQFRLQSGDRVRHVLTDRVGTVLCDDGPTIYGYRVVVQWESGAWTAFADELHVVEEGASNV